MDIELDETAETVVHHWIVTGEPGPVPGYFGAGEPPRFPSYRFVWSSADSRWPGGRAEAEARRFVDGIARSGTGPWESGPFLHQRIVTYGPLEPVDVTAYPVTTLARGSAEPLG